jgi:lactate dehydrogenase-like 2-hydroxyacid dehydrogenase
MAPSAFRPAKPVVLVVDRALARISERLEAQYETHRLWEKPDALAYAADDGRAVSAIAAMGGIPLERRLVDALPNLGLIACLASGYEGIDVGHARARGVEVTHSASVNHEDVADHAIALLLAAARRVTAGERWVRDGRWGKEPLPPVRPVRSLKVGVLGLGVIGRSVAHRLEAFGVEIAWWGRQPQLDAPYRRAESLLDLAAWADVLMVTARADRSNPGLLGAPALDALGPHGLLINVARGSIVDEDALISALRSGRLGGAALDVFQTEPTPPERWAGVDNVILTPHSAGHTTTAGQEMTDLLIENLRRFFAAEPLATPVPRA